jgi:hypothetical protein
VREKLLKHSFIELAKSGTMMAEHWPHHPKVESLNAAIDAETGRDKSGEKIQQLKPMIEWCQNACLIFLRLRV